MSHWSWTLIYISLEPCFYQIPDRFLIANTYLVCRICVWVILMIKAISQYEVVTPTDNDKRHLYYTPADVISDRLSHIAHDREWPPWKGLLLSVTYGCETKFNHITRTWCSITLLLIYIYIYISCLYHSTERRPETHNNIERYIWNMTNWIDSQAWLYFWNYLVRIKEISQHSSYLRILTAQSLRRTNCNYAQHSMLRTIKMPVCICFLKIIVLHMYKSRRGLHAITWNIIPKDHNI